MRNTKLIHSALSWLIAASCLMAAAAQAHNERPAFFPDHRATAHPQYRPLFDNNGNPSPASPRLVVCKKTGNEGINSSGRDERESAYYIARLKDDKLRSVNQQLLSECHFEHIQDAVDSVTVRGTTIYLLPGVYREQPSLRSAENMAGATKLADKAFCQAAMDAAHQGANLTYEQQFRCPHIQNTVAVFGDPDYLDDNCGSSRESGQCIQPTTQRCNLPAAQCVYYDLQIEGTGEKPKDVIITGGFINKPGDPNDGEFDGVNALRADRADGIYLRNFTTQIVEFNGVYIMETDGFVLDHMLGRYVNAYSYLAFASDHGLMTDSGGYGAGDSVLYPGGAADIYGTKQGYTGVDVRARQSTEIRNSWAHHASLGYSGTAGNAPWVHDNDFFLNMTGMATESIFGGHPGAPQDHGLYEHNLIHTNNVNYIRKNVQNPLPGENKPRCQVPPRDRSLVTENFDLIVNCPDIPFPNGAAMIIGGGNYDLFQNNDVYDNWRRALILISVPPYFRGDTTTPPDNSVFDHFYDNRFAKDPVRNLIQPNQQDFWWDQGGNSNCWLRNTSASGSVSSNVPLTPGNDALSALCPNDPPGGVAPAPDAPMVALLAPCVLYDQHTNPNPTGCDFFDEAPVPAGRTAFHEISVLEAAGGALPGDANAPVGSFLLYNSDTVEQKLHSVTLSIDNPGLFNSVTLHYGAEASDLAVTVAMDPATTTYTFDFDKANAKSSLALATSLGGGGTLLLLVGLSGGVQRRRLIWLAPVLMIAGVITGCGGISSSTGSSSGAGGGGGGSGVGGPVVYKGTTVVPAFAYRPLRVDAQVRSGVGKSAATIMLTGISVSNASSGSPVAYTGMPSSLGQLAILSP